MANLEQSQAAAQQRNWPLLNQYLRQLVLGEDPGAIHRGMESQAEIAPEQILDLALDVLEAGDFSDRWGVTKVFPKLGTGAIAPLIAILQDEEADLELRWFAARTLGEFDCPEVVTALVDLLQTCDDEDLNDMAASALANLGPSAVTALSGLLTEEHSRLLAVRSLSQIRRSETIEPLLTMVHDPQVTIRTTAIEALSSFHHPRIPPILIDALDDPAAQVRQAAVLGLGLRSDLLEELNLVDLIQPLLWDLDLEVCSSAAIALGRLGTEAAATALFQVLMLPTTPIPLQVRVVRALGWVETSNVLEYLQQALTLESEEACQEIVIVLGQVKQPGLTSKAARILIDLLRLEHPAIQAPRLKQAIALSLGELGETNAIEPLIELLASDAGVRLHAIAALKKLAPETVRYQLEHLASHGNLAPELKQGVAIALQELV
jgi:HEAT repeat protein